MKHVALVTDSTNLAVGLTTCKDYLRVTGNTENALITSLIKAASKSLESYSKRTFQSKTFDLWLDDFEDVIYIPSPPLVSVTSVTVYDDSNNATTVSASTYRVDTETDAIYLNDGYTWPTVQRDFRGVRIRFVAGYGDAADAEVPEGMQMAVMLYVATLYEHRGIACDIPQIAKDLIAPYRLLDRLWVHNGL